MTPRLHILIASVLSATLIGGAAMAQDAPLDLGFDENITDAPAQPVSYDPLADQAAGTPLRFSLRDGDTLPAGSNWTGAYVGLAIGYGTFDSSDSNPVGEAINDADGVFGGGFIGYQYDFGQYVLGAEVDFNAADFDGIDQLHRLKVRAGYDAGRFLPYITAGAAYAEGDASGSSFDDIGYLVGVGIDYQVTDRVTVGGEFIYQDFNNFDGKGVNVDATTIQARVSYRF